MYSDNLEDSQNVFMTTTNPYGEEYDHYFRSPLTMRS